jgi:rhodanese-related sulfurtransferase|mmetsp:Transcript_114687/g.180556  ORF Transcript_114687/g.180556 Transcript_114687/m.180556 type:complete len:233 (-) Transcript_114687:327-1025(-)
MMLPSLNEEQAQELLAKKKAFAESEGKGDDVCQNLKCRCERCTCGAACTCNISPDVTCDPCAEFKKSVVAKANGERLAASEIFYEEKIESNYDDVQTILASEVMEALEKRTPEVLLIDVRSPAERSVSTIPGSKTAAEFDADPEGLGAGKLVVPFCTIGGRSCQYVKQLLDRPSQPWSELRNFKLSIIGWCHAGGPLVDSKGNASKQVHACGENWAGMFPVSGFEVVLEPKV